MTWSTYFQSVTVYMFLTFSPLLLNYNKKLWYLFTLQIILYWFVLITCRNISFWCCEFGYKFGQFVVIWSSSIWIRKYNGKWRIHRRNINHKYYLFILANIVKYSSFQMKPHLENLLLFSRNPQVTHKNVMSLFSRTKKAWQREIQVCEIESAQTYPFQSSMLQMINWNK